MAWLCEGKNHPTAIFVKSITMLTVAVLSVHMHWLRQTQSHFVHVMLFGKCYDKSKWSLSRFTRLASLVSH